MQRQVKFVNPVWGLGSVIIWLSEKISTCASRTLKEKINQRKTEYTASSKWGIQFHTAPQTVEKAANIFSKYLLKQGKKECPQFCGMEAISSNFFRSWIEKTQLIYRMSLVPRCAAVSLTCVKIRGYLRISKCQHLYWRNTSCWTNCFWQYCFLRTSLGMWRMERHKPGFSDL